MKHYFRIEFNRAFYNKAMLISLLLGCGLSIWHFLDYIWPIREFVLSSEYPLSSFDRWLGGESYSFQSSLYYLVLPILCALPYSASWVFDYSTGYAGQLIVRNSHNGFVRVKYLMAFLSGAFVAVFPLLFDFCLTNLYIPAICPQKGYGLSPIVDYGIWAGYYYTHPLLYLLAYLTLDGVFFGLLNTLSFTVSNFNRNRFFVKFVPFLVYILLYAIGNSLGYFAMCPAGFLTPSQRFVTTWPWIIGYIVFLLLSCGASIYYTERQETGLI